MPKTLTLPDFLTNNMIDDCINLFKQFKDKSPKYIKERIIEPNMTSIDAKIGQKNDATYLAYAVYYILTKIPNL